MGNAFYLYQLGHTHCFKLYDSLLDVSGLLEAT